MTRDHCRRMAKKEPGEPLWVQLADEIDAYLRRDPDVIDTTPTPDDVPLEGL